MSCNDKDGGTHHNACDCREAYILKIEKQRDALLRVKDAAINRVSWRDLRSVIATYDEAERENFK